MLSFRNAASFQSISVFRQSDDGLDTTLPLRQILLRWAVRRVTFCQMNAHCEFTQFTFHQRGGLSAATVVRQPSMEKSTEAERKLGATVWNDLHGMVAWIGNDGRGSPDFINKSAGRNRLACTASQVRVPVLNCVRQC